LQEINFTPQALPDVVALGIMDGYRSPSIGKLVSARAKAGKAIKSIIKDKKAEIPGKDGKRGYQYSYADLAAVLEAIDDAISDQGLAIFQTTQSRARDGTYLVTALTHESDQWIAAEIRLKSADQGPQIYGSEMTYLRRYSVLSIMSLAPDVDDDGHAAQHSSERRIPTAPPHVGESAPRPEPRPPLIINVPGGETVQFERSVPGLEAALETMESDPAGFVLLNLEWLDKLAGSPAYRDRVAELRAKAAKALAPAGAETPEKWPGQDAGSEAPAPVA
jgi:hypothetical protein